MATGKYGGEGTNPFKTQFSSFHCGSQGSNSGRRGCATSTSIRRALSQAPGFELLIVSPQSRRKLGSEAYDARSSYNSVLKLRFLSVAVVELSQLQPLCCDCSVEPLLAIVTLALLG